MLSLLTPRDNENDSRVIVVADGWRCPFGGRQFKLGWGGCIGY